jgi:hypothetical protein
MTASRLPNIRVLSTPVANVILLTSIASRLRSQYESLPPQPVPDRIDAVLRRLA